jgi:hypothetical protein
MCGMSMRRPIVLPYTTLDVDISPHTPPIYPYSLPLISLLELSRVNIKVLEKALVVSLIHKSMIRLGTTVYHVLG